jgi:two-component system nitrate/nitrite response regulator NarL
MSELRVVVVAGDPLVRAGLAALLVQAGCEVVGQAAAEANLPAQLAVFRPDAVVWDFGWNASVDVDTWLELLADVAAADWPVVVLLSDEAHVPEIWAAGASALIGRDADAPSLLAALQAAVQALLVLDRALASIIVPARGLGHEPLVEELTPREIEVLQLLADGLTNKAIAQRLSISEHTIKFHVNAILGKLGAQSRTEAVVRATRQGLLLL